MTVLKGMKNYSWTYGIFHWFMHYFLTIMLVALSGIIIFPIFLPYTLFGIYMKNNIVDLFLVIAFSSLIDLDHLPMLKKFKFKKYIYAEKRLQTPLHNFFFLSFFAIASAISALFVSKVLAVLLFSIVLHIIWDLFEDVFIFRRSFRVWEKTWGLSGKDLEDIYNELLKTEPIKMEKESRMKRLTMRLKELSWVRIILHASVHILIFLTILISLNLRDPLTILIAIIGSGIVDIDHLSVIRKKGFIGYLYSRSTEEYGKSMKYLFHNYYIVGMSLVLSFLIFYDPLFGLGVFFLSLFLHLLFDLLEDVFIHKISTKHWKL